MLSAVLLAAACSGANSDTAAGDAVVKAGVAITVETMHPLTGQVVGSREGHGGHDGYDAAPLGSLGGSFQLVEASKGLAFSDKNLRGNWALVYFGYMECLEACPIALKTIPVVTDKLNAAGVTTRAVFVDINAPRLDDTTGGLMHHDDAGVSATPVSVHAHGGKAMTAMTGPEIRRQAIAKWGPTIDPDMIFLSGSRKELAVAVRAFQSRIEAAMLKNEEPIHHINHTTSIYVVDPYGRVAGVAYHSDSVKEMTDTVMTLVKAMPEVVPGASAPEATEAPAGHSDHG